MAQYRDGHCKASAQTIAQALEGNHRAEHLLALKQAVALYDTYQEHVAECDRHLEARLAQLSEATSEKAALPPARRMTRQRNAPSFDVRAALYALIGADLTQIHGMGSYLALKMVGECGTDMSRWPNAKHFTSWLCLAPGNKISGGKVLSARTRRSSNRASVLLRLSAINVGKIQSALGAFYRRLAARVGKAKAVTRHGPQAHGIVLQRLALWHALLRPRRVVRNLTRRARQRGYTLQPTPEGVS